MTLSVILALVVCFTNFVQLHPCTEAGNPVPGFVFIAYDSVQTMRQSPDAKHCTELSLSGGFKRFVKETPEEIIKLQEYRSLENDQK